jgi:hypothetical protein
MTLMFTTGATAICPTLPSRRIGRRDRSPLLLSQYPLGQDVPSWSPGPAGMHGSLSPAYERLGKSPCLSSTHAT